MAGLRHMYTKPTLFSEPNVENEIIIDCIILAKLEDLITAQNYNICYNWEN